MSSRFIITTRRSKWSPRCSTTPRGPGSRRRSSASRGWVLPSDGWFRIIGTVVGAVAIVVLTALLQWEALTMVAVQVFGNDHAVAFAGSQGNFQLNVYKPVILHNVLASIDLLSDASRSFEERCVRGFQPNREVIQQHVASSLMLVTTLSPHIGYEKA